MEPIIILGSLLLLAVIVLAWYIRTGNEYKRLEVKLEESRSGVEVALTKRYDTLTKLLDTTKGYMQHEQQTLGQVIRMRQGMDVGALNQAARQMDAVASQIRLTAEAYPELRSSELFVTLQKSIADTEEHLQAARRLYNANVSRFNTLKKVFPSSLLGKGYACYDFFQAEDHKRADVEIRFH